MLIEFRVANHRSIRDEQALSLEAASRDTPGDARPRALDGSRKPLLPAAALYGANASGKSNVLSALRFMCDSVASSARHWDPDGGVPRSAFAWGKSAGELSLFEATFVLDGTRFRYAFCVDDEVVQEERLEAWPHARKQTWFTRHGDEYHFGEHLTGERHTVQETTRSNALFLSNAAQLGHEQLGPLHRWFGSTLFQSVPPSLASRPDVAWELDLHRMLVRHERDQHEQPACAAGDRRAADMIDELTTLMREADLGIRSLGVSTDEGGVAALDSVRQGQRRSGVRVQHECGTGDGWLPLEEESRGTLAVIRLGPKIVAALRHGALLVVDELDTSVHPLLVRNIVDRFNHPRSNPHGAQLIFSAHDTSLLGTAVGEPTLRRDQVWLTEKDSDGATALVPLGDYKPRKGENLERGFLQGRYGAVPILPSDLADQRESESA